jgi:hypothetical protein
LGTIHLVRDDGENATLEWSTLVEPGTNFLVSHKAMLEVDGVAGKVYAGDGEGQLVQLDLATGDVEQTITLDPTNSVPHYLAVARRPRHHAAELYAATSLGTVARLNVSRGDVLRDSIGGSSEFDVLPLGYVSMEDTNTGSTSVVTHSLEVAAPATLTRFEAIAAGPGPCDFGHGPTPCFEQMEFFLMAWPLGTPFLTERDAPGKLFEIDVTSRLTLVRGYGCSRFQGDVRSPAPEGDYDVTETSLLSFDLTGLDLTCPAPGWQLALMARGSATNLGEFIIPGLPDVDISSVRIRGALADCENPADIFRAYFGQNYQPNASGLRSAGVAEGKLIVRWESAKNDLGVRAVPEWSPDLFSWYAGGEGPVGLERTLPVSVIGETVDSVQLEARLPVAELEQAFFRLRLECP